MAKIKVYYDNAPVAILNLPDERSKMWFELPVVVGPKPGLDSYAKPYWTVTLEIMEVYRGSKYNDTVLAEINFDGIDVH